MELNVTYSIFILYVLDNYHIIIFVKAINTELTEMSFLLGPDSSRGSSGLFNEGNQRKPKNIIF